MIIKKLCLATLLAFSISVTAQQKDNKQLFTIDSEPVYAKEFLRVFHKNASIVNDENKKDVKNYLELFINYKLKVKEAEEKGYDKNPSFVKEYNKYREQLAEPFLKDTKVTDQLVQEAYDRTVNEVNASHILILVKPDASPADTLKAYNKLIKARKEILSGKSFALVAKKYSEDPSAKENGGDLGYFSAFNMVYPFENAVYNLKEEEISMPFKTKFGYHIAKANKYRKSRGEVEVAHIMIKNELPDAETKINEIYKQIKNGEDFGFLAQKHSDDKFSSKNQGKLPKFGSGRMLEEFENVAFSLENNGEYSAPFQTKYGWHIVKLVKKYPTPSFEKLKDFLKSKIERSDRAQIVGNTVLNRLKKEYKIVNNFETVANYKNWKERKDNFKTILEINDKKIREDVYYKYLYKTRQKSNKASFDKFLNKQIATYFKDNLHLTNEDFASTIKEYKEGLLLFDLLQKQIWDKSEKDTLGLQKYFANHQDKYQWNDRADVIIATSTEEAKLKKVRKALKKNQDLSKLREEFNKDKNSVILFKEGVFETTEGVLPKGMKMKKGVSKVMKEGQNQYVVIFVKDVLKAGPKELKEVRGQVISDYQGYIENEWVNDLRNKHEIIINQDTLNEIINQEKNK
ncbi:peptidylprolyl isomerase [Aureivirga sp. CE67]|uniref:peptidylprolyl isomerase n=1 Tax=Aureivirga sp. CE67 TaxID=1788983 RepID=UPI0018CABDCF|nr:peptidylprolyl isomerase [Aureivirga sp. CE67]